MRGGGMGTPHWSEFSQKLVEQKEDSTAEVGVRSSRRASRTGNDETWLEFMEYGYGR